MNTVVETDWLGSNPVFYNEDTKLVSSNINDVIDYSNLIIDENGFNDYLSFGYSVFGNTVIKNVKYLLPHSRLEITDDKLTVTELPDPALKYLGTTSNENDIIELIRENIRRWEDKDDKQVVIPTSGGYDSRLLNFLSSNKSKLQTFGYGLTSHQEEPLCGNSQEIVFANELSKILGTNFQQIPLGDFHKYNDYWYEQFGVSTHLHGMYHVEFYNKIKNIIGPNTKVLSGIVGDVWAGMEVPEIDSPEKVSYLGLSHGIIGGGSLIQRTKHHTIEYFEKYKELLKEPRYRVLALIRTKMMLLRYLMSIPQSLGLDCDSPFMDIDIAMGMLTINPSRRKNRQWQIDFFRNNGIMIEDMNLSYDPTNVLDHYADFKMPLPNIEKSILGNYINSDYIDQININRFTYNAKVVLLPIQKLLEQRPK